MVLELLLNPFQLKKRPWELFVVGMVYTAIAIFLSYFVFRDGAGLLMIFLIVLATLPTLYTTIKHEEEIDLVYDKEIMMLKEHTKVIIFLISLFMGITFALVLSYVLLPSAVVDSIFVLQQNAIANVIQTVNDDVILTGDITKLSLFGNIFINNIKVLFFCLVFSFLYGTGAMFILTWNASVIATAMGTLVKNELGNAAHLVGLPYLSAYFGAATFSFFRYMTHGIIEIAAYFIAGLAGGIISIALIKHNLNEDKVLVDALDLILISLGFLFVAAFVEVYITPIIF
ncbi:MAG: stage II sporulation protein M [archaeon]|nr:stage II sporulation protein M [archaeon]